MSNLKPEINDADLKLVQVLEKAVEIEVLKRIEEPLRTVVQDAVRRGYNNS